MTVFKTFLKVLNKYKGTVIMYTIFLIAFGGLNMQTSDNSTNFVASKPNVLIVNQDKDSRITQNLTDYIKKNSKIIEIDDNEEARNDALFYRDVNYIIYIPANYTQDFLNKLDPKIEIKSTGDYQSSYAEMLLSRYIKIANIYVQETTNEEELTNKINDTLKDETQVEVTSKIDTNKLSKATFFYNFLSYSMLAGGIFVICLILTSFHTEKIRKRTIISSMNYKEHNRMLLLANGLFAIVLWVIYVILSFILVGEAMFSMSGLIYILNSFVFTICVITIAFLIANLVNNKSALNGIVNVVALGSSFLCGAFVPAEWLPDSVLTFAHILPSYWYIQTNELLKTIDVFNIETLQPIFVNMGVLLGFSALFVIITNFVSNKKRKIG